MATKFSSQMVQRNMGWWVFKGGIQNKFERFLAKNQHTQRKLLYFANTYSLTSKIGNQKMKWLT